MYHLFYEYLKSSRYLRIFCTLTATYDKSKKPSPRFRPYPFLWFYAFALLFQFAIMTFAAAYIIVELKNEKMTKVAVKLVKIAVTLDILLVIYKSQSKFTECMNSILHYEEEAKKFNFQMRYRSLRILLLAKKIMVLGTSFIGNLSCFMTGNTLVYCVVSFITYNITYLISSIVLTQFCGLILTARQHLIIVNKGLFNLAKNPTRAVEKMNELMSYHFEICDMSLKVNQAFSAQLLLIIVRTFVEFFNSLHSLVKEKSHLLVMYDLFWSTCALFEFIFMLFACKRATETCSRTGRILNLLDTNKDKKLDLLRNVFLLQIKHKYVTFSANSLFSIDNKMFLHLISTSVAYLLIIIQFEKE